MILLESRHNANSLVSSGGKERIRTLLGVGLARVDRKDVVSSGADQEGLKTLDLI